MRSKIGTVIVIMLALLVLPSCSGDWWNTIERKKVEYLDGNYDVTFASEGHIKTWHVLNDKVTTVADKGYYYFWANNKGKKIYVQTPVRMSYVEEIK